MGSEREEHRLAEVREYPDNTDAWVCVCGEVGTSYQSIDLVNDEWRRHVRSEER